MLEDNEQKNSELLEQAGDQLALLFFQLIVEKNKKQIKDVKKKYEPRRETKQPES